MRTSSCSLSFYCSSAGSDNSLQAAHFVPRTTGRLAWGACDAGAACGVRTYDGSRWSPPATVTTSVQCNATWDGCSFSAVSEGDTTYAALVTSSGASFFSYPYGGPASQTSTVKSTGSDSIQVALTTDSSGRPFATVADSTTNA